MGFLVRIIYFLKTLTSTASPKIMFPKIAPSLPAMNWTPREVERSFVGYNSVPMQPNELNVTTLIAPKMVVKITPCVELLMNGMPNTDMPDSMKLKAWKKRI